MSRDRFRDEHSGSAPPWLLGIARNVLRETIRHERVETRARRRLGLPLDLVAEDGFATVEEKLSPRTTLAAALHELPQHERDALQVGNGHPTGTRIANIRDVTAGVFHATGAPPRA